MRKVITLIIVALLCLSLNAQETEGTVGYNPGKNKMTPHKINEIKLNMATTIVLLHPEISYERILSEDFSIGTALGFTTGSMREEYPIKLILLPYARWFFGGSALNQQKYAAGFFVEVNLAILNGEINESSILDEVQNSSVQTGFGVGIAGGWKYLSSNNWVGEIYLGMGREFIHDGGYPRFGLSIGKRF